jgi:acyl carrier protein
MKEIEKLQEVFCSVFENPNIKINEQTVAADIPEWDSLNHIILIVEIEKVFNIKFSSSQIYSWKSVGNVLDDISNG